MTNQELLTKVKENLNLDIDNNEQDNYLLSLIDSVKNMASKKTGIDFEIEDMADGIAYSIIDNVSNKFDDGGYEMDVSIFQMYNNEPMI